MPEGLTRQQAVEICRVLHPWRGRLLRRHRRCRHGRCFLQLALHFMQLLQQGRVDALLPLQLL